MGTTRVRSNRTRSRRATVAGRLKRACDELAICGHEYMRRVSNRLRIPRVNCPQFFYRTLLPTSYITHFIFIDYVCKLKLRLLSLCCGRGRRLWFRAQSASSRTEGGPHSLDEKSQASGGNLFSRSAACSLRAGKFRGPTSQVRATDGVWRKQAETVEPMVQTNAALC